MFDLDNFLEHHGIKGMKWGVRRTQAQLDSASDDSKAASAAASKAKAAGGTHALSNTELQSLVNRMNLEQQYSNLASKSSTTSRSAATKFLKDIGTNVVRTQLTNAANMVIKNQIKQALKKRGLT